MAVDAHRSSFPPQQLNQDRNSLNQGALWPPYILQQICFLGRPSVEGPQGNPISHQPPLQDTIHAVKNDSSLTSNVSVQRKRSIDSLEEFRCGSECNFSEAKAKSGFYLSGEEIAPQIQQSEIDAVIAQHTKRIRLGLEQREKQHLRFLSAAISAGATKKLREKDEQMQRIGRLNQIFQERVKLLTAENQFWRESAQSSEATANSLRSNIEQVLHHAAVNQRVFGVPPAAQDDAESSCSSSSGSNSICPQAIEDRLLCRRCREKVASVIVLPCRHLCLCTLCGSGAHQLRLCPVCHCGTNATLHVNLSR